ncbi:MAG TPA: matrixin family metalloprotease [Gemmatimonadaceae bacterium]|nr:matrixin family metalloprotease [Gemmatimonadaceae bacterium]
MHPLTKFGLAATAAAACAGLSGAARPVAPVASSAQHAWPPGAIFVWIQPGAHVPGWRPDDVSQAVRAFAAWNGIVPAVRFAITDDSADAAVRVTWADRFDERTTGEARLVRDTSGAVVEASVELAVHHADGRPVFGDAMRALAMHEVGHLLGLAHSGDRRSIMAPTVRVRVLSAGDSAALRRAYATKGRE